MHSFDSSLSFDSTNVSKSTLNLLPVSEFKPKEVDSPILRISSIHRQEEDFRDCVVDKKVRQIMESYSRTNLYRHLLEYIKHDSPENHIPMSVPESVLDTFTRIIDLYHITYCLVDKEIKDSGVVVKAVEEKADILFTMAVLLPEFQKFPSTLFKALKIMKFTFCGKIEMKSASKMSTFVRKYYNWKFMVQEHLTPTEIKRHFYCTIWFNIMKELENFQDHWMKLYPEGKHPKINTEMIVIPQSKANKEINAPAFSIMDQFEVFTALIENPNAVFSSKDILLLRRARLIREALESFDPEGINQLWWAERCQ